LSQEFRVYSDPVLRRSLGELAMETVSEGDYRLDQDEDSTSPQYIYEPGWAPHITALVSCRTHSKHDVINLIELRKRAGKRIFVSDANEEIGSAMHVNDGRESRDFDLSALDRRVRARETIAHVVAGFINTD
jgi:hypothetical protein